MNGLSGIAKAKEIEFVCKDCRKKIATDTVNSITSIIHMAFPPLEVIELNGMLVRLEESTKAKVICNECIKSDMRKAELDLLSKICITYSIIKKSKEPNSPELIDFEQYVNYYEREDFENILSKFSIEQFINANSKDIEKLKRKAPKFLAQKVQKIIDNHFSSNQNKNVYFPDKITFMKLIEKNKLFPMKKYTNKSISSGGMGMINFDSFYMDNTCQDVEFYLLSDQKQSDFVNAYINNIGAGVFNVNSIYLDLENAMYEILAKRFISLYVET